MAVNLLMLLIVYYDIKNNGFSVSMLRQHLFSKLFSNRALADTKQMGKLNREQFALAMYLIQQKVSKGADPPQVLTPEMIPPSERTTPVSVRTWPYSDIMR